MLLLPLLFLVEISCLPTEDESQDSKFYNLVNDYILSGESIFDSELTPSLIFDDGLTESGATPKSDFSPNIDNFLPTREDLKRIEKGGGEEKRKEESSLKRRIESQGEEKRKEEPLKRRVESQGEEKRKEEPSLKRIESQEREEKRKEEPLKRRIESQEEREDIRAEKSGLRTIVKGRKEKKTKLEQSVRFINKQSANGFDYYECGYENCYKSFYELGKLKSHQKNCHVQ